MAAEYRACVSSKLICDIFFLKCDYDILGLSSKGLGSFRINGRNLPLSDNNKPAFSMTQRSAVKRSHVRAKSSQNCFELSSIPDISNMYAGVIFWSLDDWLRLTNSSRD